MAEQPEKEWIVTHPKTGEVRTVTQRDWNAAQLGKLGFVKPKDLVEVDGPIPVQKPTVIQPPPANVGGKTKPR